MKYKTRNYSGFGRKAAAFAAALFCTVSMCFSVPAAQIEAAAAKAITNAAGLLAIGANKDTLAGSYYLASDIDLSGMNWAPIGSMQRKGSSYASQFAYPFTGTFDGRGHAIKNMTQGTGSTGADRIGLFDGNTGTIKNLRLENVNLSFRMTKFALPISSTNKQTLSYGRGIVAGSSYRQSGSSWTTAGNGIYDNLYISGNVKITGSECSFSGVTPNAQKASNITTNVTMTADTSSSTLLSGQFEWLQTGEDLTNYGSLSISTAGVPVLAGILSSAQLQDAKMNKLTNYGNLTGTVKNATMPADALAGGVIAHVDIDENCSISLNNLVNHGDVKISETIGKEGTVPKPNPFVSGGEGGHSGQDVGGVIGEIEFKHFIDIKDAPAFGTLLNAGNITNEMTIDGDEYPIITTGSVIGSAYQLQNAFSMTMSGLMGNFCSEAVLINGKPVVYGEDYGVYNGNSTKKTTVPVQNMYRLYNPNGGEHFYTADTKERNFLITNGWKSEGIGWYAPVVANPETTTYQPVYRLYNPNGGDHHYTMVEREKDYLVSVGWKYEGIGWYSFDTGKPLYRQYNPNAKSGSHNYTTDYNEHTFLTRNGWKDEKVSWYGAS